MTDNRRTAAEYPPEQAEIVRATCLYVGTKLGDLADDIVIVGGFVPSLLVEQERLGEGVERHVGTMDLDLGLTLAVLTEQRYQALASRLREAGFSADLNEQGNPTRQRWKIERKGKVTVDFLIPPSLPSDRPGTLRDLQSDFAAVIASGLHLAFQDRKKVKLAGPTIMDEHAERELWVCGPGAYIVMKALSFNARGSAKDAYDLFYLIRHYGSGVAEIAHHLSPLASDGDTVAALDIIRRDFTRRDGIGAARVAEFLGGPDDALQADVAGFARELLDAFDRS